MIHVPGNHGGFEPLAAIIERMRVEMKVHQARMMAIMKAGLGEIEAAVEPNRKK
jgi:hypothetical protein